MVALRLYRSEHLYLCAGVSAFAGGGEQIDSWVSPLNTLTHNCASGTEWAGQAECQHWGPYIQARSIQTQLEQFGFSKPATGLLLGGAACPSDIQLVHSLLPWDTLAVKEAPEEKFDLSKSAANQKLGTATTEECSVFIGEATGDNSHSQNLQKAAVVVCLATTCSYNSGEVSIRLQHRDLLWKKVYTALNQCVSTLRQWTAVLSGSSSTVGQFKTMPTKTNR